MLPLLDPAGGQVTVGQVRVCVRACVCIVFVTFWAMWTCWSLEMNLRLT